MIISFSLVNLQEEKKAYSPPVFDCARKTATASI